MVKDLVVEFRFRKGGKYKVVAVEPIIGKARRNGRCVRMSIRRRVSRGAALGGSLPSLSGEVSSRVHLTFSGEGKEERRRKGRGEIRGESERKRDTDIEGRKREKEEKKRVRERERERETEKKARTFGCAGLNRDPAVRVGEKKKKKARNATRRATGDSRCRARD